MSLESSEPKRIILRDWWVDRTCWNFSGPIEPRGPFSDWKATVYVGVHSKAKPMRHSKRCIREKGQDDIGWAERGERKVRTVGTEWSPATFWNECPWTFCRWEQRWKSLHSSPQTECFGSHKIEEGGSTRGRQRRRKSTPKLGELMARTKRRQRENRAVYCFKTGERLDEAR